MKFLIDENVPQQLITDFRKKGHDVLDIKASSHKRKSDEKLGKIAQKENRTIITYDKDFLSGSLDLGKYPRIIIRIPYSDLSVSRQRLLEVLDSYPVEKSIITLYPRHEHVEKL